ncbi:MULTISPECIES: hypothetical protein [unclassified Enterococcus]|uniref:hypothetical protein n=1 Tax=unclassified Enterococcus TaxID=2608891 RepID=UPI00190540D4|nr:MULTISPECIES: hypothetical protein [unclassified Enterococcus]MBK0038343.1 hypothetical protein [Enterococcus sp. S52]MBK0070975.1 hypothetical protein [Enterococcus sp. S53]MBK0141500.1 hypothetical protein [Enterococcus sp. S76]MBK0144925.1 hypothetical protein [Enterococcus sp. S77]
MNRYLALFLMLVELVFAFIILSFIFSLSFSVNKVTSIPGITKGFPLVLGLMMLMIGFTQKPFLSEKRKRTIIVNLIFGISATIMIIPFFDDYITDNIGKLILLLADNTSRMLNSLFPLTQTLENPFHQSLSTYVNDIGSYFLFGLNAFGLFNQTENIKNLFIELVHKHKKTT